MYEELVMRLREAPDDWPDADLHYEAADAIEELVRKEKFHEFLWNTIPPNKMNVYLSMYNDGKEKGES